jgi:bifunctional non-homologous end joining protein LigD
MAAVQQREKRKSSAQPMPGSIRPMLARLSELPDDDRNFGFEIKWDGVRAISYFERGTIRMQSRNMRDITHQYPEVHVLANHRALKSAILDGEIVALNDAGRPSFEALQTRMGVSTSSLARQRARLTPVIYMIFDILFVDGISVLHLPFTERRALLQSLNLSDSHWQTPPFCQGDGSAMLKVSREQGLEGIVAKRLDSVYEAGVRSGAWLKIKNVRRQEFVIAGWLPGEGSRAGTIGSLLMGVYAPDPVHGGKQNLLYAGKAGTGFTDAMLDKLKTMLAPLRVEERPFASSSHLPKGAVFVQPRHVAEFEFTEWTKQGILRHPSFKGLRPDKNPEDVVREDAPIVKASPKVTTDGIGG